jgi:NTE family protein
MSVCRFRLASVAAFKGLDADALDLLEQELTAVPVPAGTVLVREGEEPEALYIVVSGRFSVEVAASAEPVAEISSGGTIGEIAFFAGGTRTATCRAIRDSAVLRLTRARFDAISRSSPAIWSNITATLAQRLAAETRKSARLKGAAPAWPRPRTIAIVPAGPDRDLPGMLDRLIGPLNRLPGTCVISSANAAKFVGSSGADAHSMAHALNTLEEHFDTVVYMADTGLTAFTQLAIRQADEVLLAGYQGASPLSSPVALNAAEEFSYALPKRRHRLVLVHPQRHGIQGTRHWLANRPVVMHHHIADGDEEDLARLWRFVRGEASGLVACGGGAYCAAHIGLYKAFCESGHTFDILGGSSGGAAMAAAFAEGMPAGEIDARVHTMFVEGRAMARYTLPRYGLLDHTHFDRHLREQYGETLIEDLWKPYFAVAFDLTDVALRVIRTGPAWAAIRASSAIPGLLPPYIDARGHLLVDGSVAANVPIDVMHQVKAGPNVVVTFDKPLGERITADYSALPGRRELLRHTLNPWSKSILPDAPTAGSVLVRALMANRNHFETLLEPGDWLLMPPVPADMGPLDWRRHRELMESTYRFVQVEIAGRLGRTP